MASLEQFLETRLKLKVNQTKSAVARPAKRQFLGYTIVGGATVRIRISFNSRARFVAKVRQILRGARGRNLAATIEELNPLLRGWAAYFKLAEAKTLLKGFDRWIRRKLRGIIWRQWKRVYTRARNLMRRGLDEVTAWKSATNGRGPWWNSGASHMNRAFPVSYFDQLGLIRCLIPFIGCRACYEPPYTEPYVRWCVGGRRSQVRLLPDPRNVSQV